jgi:molecular chaperone DnaK
MEACEKAKIELSNTTTTEINLPYITAVDGVPVHLVQSVTKAKFETLIDGHIRKVVECAKEAMKKADLAYTDITSILLVGGTTRIPALQSALEREFGVVLNKSLNPDEAVAQGAAVQAGILGGEVTDILLLDVTPLRLSIETYGGIATTMIEANTTIPTKKTEVFSTAADNQPAITVRVLQGERPMANDNKQIGIFNLDGIAPAMRGVPQIEVTFDIDSNGILKVTATDKGTGKEQHIEIKESCGLSDEEIQRMKDDAKANEAADKKRREDAEKLNMAEVTEFQTRKQIEELGDKITDEDKKSLNEKCTALEDAVKSVDYEKIETAQNELQTAWYAVSAKLYAQVQPEGNPAETILNPDGSMFNGGMNN